MKKTSFDVKLEKHRVRERIWKSMEESGVTLPPLPPRGRIPNFKGADLAARKLDLIPEYRDSKKILVSPDSPQIHVREKVLSDGKTLIVATPRLKDGFIVVEPENLPDFLMQVVTIKGTYKYGRIINLLPSVDFVVEGCVAVGLRGFRLGKGGGYGDVEIALAKAINPNVKVAVTCHSMQVLSTDIPHEEKDQKVDYILTEKDLLIVKK